MNEKFKKFVFRFAGGTLLSRFSGVVRESVVGAVFGSSPLMDAFVIAYRIPNLLRDLLAEGALGSSFTKVYAETSERDPARARKFLGEIYSATFIVTLVISVLGALLAGPIVDLTTSLEHDPRRVATVGLTSLLFPYIMFASLGAVAMGALYQKSKFFVSSFSPVLFNGASILGATLFASYFAQHPMPWMTDTFGGPMIFGLAMGVLLGGLLQFLFQFLYAIPRQIFPLSFWNPEIRKVVLLMLPMILATSASQINVMVNTHFATTLESGSVSWLNYAFRVLQLPVGMFGVAVGAVALPELSRQIANSHGQVTEAISGLLWRAVDLVLWLTLPCFVLMMTKAEAIVRLLYEAGAFAQRDTFMTAEALRSYSYALLGYGLIKVMTSFYYAIDKTFFAMVVSLLSIAVNYVLNAWLVQKYGISGLAWTMAGTLTWNALLLMGGSFYFGTVGKTPVALRRGGIFVLITAMTLAASYFIPSFDGYFGPGILTKKIAAAVELGISGFVIGGVFFAAARLMRSH